jgi:hypothetical protein
MKKLLLILPILFCLGSCEPVLAQLRVTFLTVTAESLITKNVITTSNTKNAAGASVRKVSGVGSVTQDSLGIIQSVALENTFGTNDIAIQAYTATTSIITSNTVLDLPTGTFTVDSANYAQYNYYGYIKLTKGQDHVTIQGNNTTLICFGGGVPTVWFDSVNYGRITGVNFVSYNGKFQGAGVRIRGTSNLEIDHCNFYNVSALNDTYDDSTPATPTNQYVNFHDNHVVNTDTIPYDLTGPAIFLFGLHGSEFAHNWFIGCFSTALALDAGHFNKGYNYSHPTDTLLVQNPIIGNLIADNHFIFNTFRDTTVAQTGQHTRSSGTAIFIKGGIGNHVIGNKIDSALTGIDIEQTRNQTVSVNNTIEANKITNGLLFVSGHTGSGIVVDGAVKNTQILGNTTQNCGNGITLFAYDHRTSPVIVTGQCQNNITPCYVSDTSYVLLFPDSTTIKGNTLYGDGCSISINSMSYHTTVDNNDLNYFNPLTHADSLQSTFAGIPYNNANLTTQFGSNWYNGARQVVYGNINAPTVNTPYAGMGSGINLFYWSQQFQQTGTGYAGKFTQGWSRVDSIAEQKNVYIYDSVATSPRGDMSAYRLSKTTMVGQATLRQTVILSSPPAGQTCTYSAYVMSANGDTHQMNIGFSSPFDSVTYGNLGFALATPTWQRVSFTFTFPASALHDTIATLLAPSTNYAADSIYLWGAQLEFNPQPTIYIPTTNAPSSLVTGVIANAILASQTITLGTSQILFGSGSPNGSVIGSPGYIYINTAGGSATTLWVKESGSGTNTGWIGK